MLVWFTRAHWTEATVPIPRWCSVIMDAVIWTGIWMIARTIP